MKAAIRPSSRRATAVRLLKRGAITLAALALAYVVAVNVFLSTALFEKVIDADPDTIDIHYRSGWSLIPGHIHAKGLSIRGRDSHVEWILRLDEADFDMSFAALLRKRFDVSRVHGRGISFRLRTRLAAPPIAEDRVSELPTIEGFGAYSVRPPPVASPDVWSDAAYHLWTAHLERIVADDVRELWIDHVRFEGEATIAGRFYLKPLRAVSVGPARVEVREGQVTEGAVTLARGLSGSRVKVTVAPFDPRTAEGAELVHHVSAELDVRGECPEVGALSITWPATMIVAGPVAVDSFAVQWVDGVVTGPGHAKAEAPRSVVSVGGHRAAAALSLTAVVRRVDGRDRLEAEMLARAITVARADGAVLRAERVRARIDSEHLDLSSPLDDLHAVIELPEAIAPRARDLAPYLPASARSAMREGRASVEASVEAWLAEKRASGHVRLGADGVDVRLATMRLRGAASARAEVASWWWSTGRLEGAQLAIDVPHASLDAIGAQGALAMEVDGLHGEARARAVDLADPLAAFEIAIRVPKGRWSSGGAASASVPASTTSPRVLASFSFAGHALVADHVARGAFELHAPRARIAYRDLDATFDLAAGARVDGWRLDGGNLALSDARARLSAVSVRRNGANARAPAAVTLGAIALRARSARFAFADPLSRVTLDASLERGAVSDASVLASFLPAQSGLAIVADDGKFDGRIHADVARSVARGTVVVRAENAGVAAKQIRVGGDAEVTADIAEWSLRDDTMTVRDARATVTHAKGSLKPGAGWDFGAERIELSGSAQRIDLAHPTLTGVDGRLTVVDGVLPDARALQSLLPDGGILTFESGRARVSAEMALSAPSGSATGVVDVMLTRSGVRFHEVHFVGDFHARVRVRASEAERGSMDLSGSTLEMRNVYVTNASTDASRWRGDATALTGTFRLDPPELDTSVSLDAYDASPLLAVLLRNDLPKSMAVLTKMPHLLASARVTVDPHAFALRDVQAQGGNLALRGCYVARGEHRLGAFVVDKGFVSVGLRLGDTGGPGLRFFGLDGWLRGETDGALRLWDSK